MLCAEAVAARCLTQVLGCAGVPGGVAEDGRGAAQVVPGSPDLERAGDRGGPAQERALCALYEPPVSPHASSKIRSWTSRHE